MEGIAGAACRQIPYVVGVSAAARAALERLVDDDGALQQWGGTVLTSLADAVVPVVTHDSGLARRLATTVLTYNETRDEHVSFGGSALLPMNESRRQQAGHGVYRLGQSFGQLAAADLVAAAQIFCDLAEDSLAGKPSDRWPVHVGADEGWLRYGQDLSLTDHDVGAAAARALASALAVAGPEDGQAALSVLVQRLHNAGGWAALMSSTGDPVARGQNLLPALGSGALLAHPQSHPAAAGLVSALAEHVPELAERLEAAVLEAHSLADANGVGQVAKDALIGCLRRDAITSASLRARLDELGAEGVPDPQPYVQIESWSPPWSVIESLAEDGIELKPEIERPGTWTRRCRSSPALRAPSPHPSADSPRRSMRRTRYSHPTRRFRPRWNC
jgi:hypothetical protein